MSVGVERAFAGRVSGRPAACASHEEVLALVARWAESRRVELDEEQMANV